MAAGPRSGPVFARPAAVGEAHERSRALMAGRPRSRSTRAAMLWSRGRTSAGSRPPHARRAGPGRSRTRCRRTNVAAPAWETMGVPPWTLEEMPWPPGRTAKASRQPGTHRCSPDRVSHGRGVAGLGTSLDSAGLQPPTAMAFMRKSCLRNVRKSGDGGNRTHVRNRVRMASTSVAGALISSSARLAGGVAGDQPP